MITRLTYASTVTAGHGHSDFLEIVAFSQKANLAMQIGGMIAFDGFQFIQIIEGEDAIVAALFSRIAIDRRNDGVVELRSQRVMTRHFDDWSVRRMPLVNVLMMSAILNDESAVSKRTNGEVLTLSVRLHLSLAQMSMSRPATVAKTADMTPLLPRPVA